MVLRRKISIITIICVFALLFAGAGGTAFAGNNSGLVAHYTFDGDFKDSSSSGMDGTPVGDVSFADDGVAGKCAVFNQGYLNVANSSSFNLGEKYTIAVWVKLDQSVREGGKTVSIISKLGKDGGQAIWDVYGDPQNMELLQRYANDVETIDTQPAGYIDCDQKWTHLVFENDGKTMYAYVDGKLVSTYKMQRPSGEGGALVNSDGDVMIGNNDSSKIFSGKMDDLRIYNYVLSADEVKAIANTGASSHKIVLQLLNTKMTVDGKEMPIDPSNTSVYPYSEEGRTLVPIRAIIESMGGKIGWDSRDRRVDITYKSTNIKLWIDNTSAEVNGKQLTLDVPPRSVQGRTMLPLRFVVENLGAKVNWDGKTQKITINY